MVPPLLFTYCSASSTTNGIGLRVCHSAAHGAVTSTVSAENRPIIAATHVFCCHSVQCMNCCSSCHAPYPATTQLAMTSIPQERSTFHGCRTQNAAISPSHNSGGV